MAVSKKKVSPRKPSTRRKGSPPKPWEMQEEESLEAFRYFCFYRDMERRSIRAASKALGFKSARPLEKMSGRYNWVDRCRAWDVELDRRVRDITTKNIADMKKRHINIGIGMQTAVVKELQAWVAKIEEKAAEASKAGKKYHDPLLSVSDLIRLSQHGTQIERLNRGEPTDRTQLDVPGEEDLASLSVSELKALKSIKAKLAGGE